jgi:hypothetical protein
MLATQETDIRSIEANPGKKFQRLHLYNKNWVLWRAPVIPDNHKA